MQIPLIAPTTSAVTTKAEVNAQGYDQVVVQADNIAGAETVDVYVDNNGTWTVARDQATGLAIQCTATNPIAVLIGGMRYGVTKTATAGACGVSIRVRQSGFTS